MSIAGALDLRLNWDGRRVTGAEVLSSRPEVSRLLAGKPAAEVQRLLPLLYSLCGKAQGWTGRAAVAAARGETLTPVEHGQAARDILREAAAEHLWRLLLDWPVALGLPNRQKELASARRLLLAAPDESSWREALDRVLAETLLGRPAALWLEGDFHEWAASDAPAAVLWRSLRETTRDVTPILSNQTENSPLDRLGRRLPENLAPVAARFLSRLAEPALWAAGQLPAPDKLLRAENLGEGAGEARGLVSRGILRHRVRLEGDTVVDYAISVPTDRNFQPGGPFEREARGISGDCREEVESAARILALSLDPCVPVTVTVVEVEG